MQKFLLIAVTAFVTCAGLMAFEHWLKLEQSDVYRLVTQALAIVRPRSRSAPPAPAPMPYANQPYADQPYAALIQGAAQAAAIDPALVHAVIFVESGYNANARSPKGAVGLMQVMPMTASRYGVPDPAQSPEANVTAGTRHLKHLLHKYGGRLDLVLAAYNAGETAVSRHHRRIPPYPETQRYVPAVLAKYREWQSPSLPPPAASATSS
jgi:soluble lytic murein transglycosylase-like protein